MKFLGLILMLAMNGMYLDSKAYNIRQITSRNNLSNSAVICLFQDKERYLWIGTYDGLNKYNGTDIQIYKPSVSNRNSLSGNVIRRIVESKNDYLWIMTKGGLNKFSKKKDRVEAHFEEFQEDCSIACDSHGNFFILTQTGFLYYYEFSEQAFKKIEVPHFKPTKSWVSLIIDRDDKIWITNDGSIRQYAIKPSGNHYLNIGWLGPFDHSEAISYIYNDKGTIFIVDRKGDLYSVRSGKKSFIRNIQSAITQYGVITSVLSDGKDIIIGFRTSGVIKLHHQKKYGIEKFPISCGVFSLYKDDVQDILWIGTDGQGVYAYAQDDYIFDGINLDELPVKTQRPVRAIFKDHRRHLWLGTKGNGIIKIKDYENASEYDGHNVVHLTDKDGLSNNAVFAFRDSRRNNVLWIGSEGPQLNYYSYDDNKIHSLKNNSRVAFAEVHSILETSDTTLWVGSLFSLLKVDIRKKGGNLEAHRIRKYDFDIKNKQLYNLIFSIYQESDSILWLAMRGNGAIRFNSKDGTYRLITFDKNGIVPMNDILSIHHDQNRNYWFGSSYGINKLEEPRIDRIRYRNYNDNDRLHNNTIHGILENRDGKFWLSSNGGIVLFDPDKKTFRTFNQKSGLKVIEFSDNAYYKDERSSTYFFGGIDGVIWIKHGERKKNDFISPIYFTKLRILNEETNINDFLINKDDKTHLQLKYNQNFFTVSFAANDFIDGATTEFSYMLENFNEVWMNTNSREAQFTNIPPGEYVLKVKYDDAFGNGSRMASLTIKILPPWYLRIYAKLFFWFAAICLMLSAFLHLKKKYERKKMKLAKQLDQKYKEEMYENKLLFFTNITHEFCTPLTLIHTPTERILNHEGSDDFVKKYAHIIKSNTERLNNLIQEILDFRRMETGNNICKIERCNITDICHGIMDAFADLAEENNINFSLDISSVLIWNSDRRYITTILNNLVSNAFKYTRKNGFISICVTIENNELVLKVYNKGEGIREEDIPHIFNRYSVLDNVGQNPIKGLSSRNGLGLAICKSMVDLLEGEIGINSEAGRYAEFIVRLPTREPETEQNNMLSNSYMSDSDKYSNKPSIAKNGLNKNRMPDSEDNPTILIVDDNEEMLWVLKDILSENYQVVTAKEGREGLKRLTSCMPDLVITDIMMPDQDGISMTKQIKINPYTMHIPLIMISAKSAINDTIEGIKSGADAYITKPFDIKYLKTVIKQLIEKQKKLREYYNSSASSFDYMNGRLLSKEDRDFLQSVLRTVEQHVSNLEFGPEDLADKLRISLRSLYRRFKDLELLPPKDFIKSQRIEYSAKLLLSTNLTIQEIMYNAGFSTRSHFYKEFTKRYHLTPKEYREQGTIRLNRSDKND